MIDDNEAAALIAASSYPVMRAACITGIPLEYAYLLAEISRWTVISTIGGHALREPTRRHGHPVYVQAANECFQRYGQRMMRFGSLVTGFYCRQALAVADLSELEEPSQ